MLAQLVLVAAAARLLQLTLPLPELCGLFAAMLLFNGFTWWRSRHQRAVGDTELLLQLFVDVSALSLVLYFTGGATNPFVSFYLPALAVAAAILPTPHALLLAQVVSTLLDNAAQAVGNGGVVELESRMHAASVTICIRDEGPGINAELLPRLGYEPVRSTTGGKGIGLMLAFATARQLGARLALASRPGQGTTALLTLPLSMPADVKVSPLRPSVDAPVDSRLKSQQPSRNDRKNPS